VFDQVEFRGNVAGASGGGVYSHPETRPVFTSVTMTGNSAISGGGVYNESYYLVMTGADISGNYARTYGGGIFNMRAGAVLTNIRLENNRTDNPGTGQANGGGSALYMEVNTTSVLSGDLRDVVIITNGVIRGNTTEGSGAGIFCHYLNNTIDAGKPAYHDTILHLALTNVLIAENRAGYGAGGIILYNMTNDTITMPGKGISVLMNNVTIAGNTSDTNPLSTWHGGGFRYNPGTSSGPVGYMRLTANNSVIWGNNSQRYAETDDIYQSNANRLILKNSLAPDFTVGRTYGYFDGGSNTLLAASPFASGYSLNSSYAGTYDSSLYPTAANWEAALLSGPKNGDQTNTAESDPVLQEPRYTEFRNLVEQHAVPHLTDSNISNVGAAYENW
jgi:hypothetical protein